MNKYLLFVILLCFNILHNCECDGREMKKNNLLNNGDIEENLPALYPDAASILKVLRDHQNIRHKGVKDLLNLYSLTQAKKSKFDAAGDVKKYPLILIEGLSGSGKTTISEALAKKINGTQVHSPTPKVKQLQIEFKGNPFIRNVYHQISHYITAMEIIPLLNDGPVVLDRYYPSSATYSIARSVLYHPERLIPPKGDKVYNWPEDLLKPDIVIFLQVDEKERYQRLISRTNKVSQDLGNNELTLHNNYVYRTNVLLAYKNLENLHVTFVNDNPTQEEVLEDVYSKILPLLKKQ